MKIEELKTISIDGKEYVEKSDVMKFLKKNMQPQKFRVLVKDPLHIYGFGSGAINEYGTVDVDIDILKKCLDILQNFDMEYVTFAFRQDYPLILGEINDERTRINGIIIAPRIKPRE